ncbi:hypothetical protein [Gemmatimonas sp.]|uniref:hypothetical protein n=1 Tax=Gemmatimonas sp. TaxID=1962908 RepID=UPI0035635178
MPLPLASMPLASPANSLAISGGRSRSANRSSHEARLLLELHHGRIRRRWKPATVRIDKIDDVELVRVVFDEHHIVFNVVVDEEIDAELDVVDVDPVRCQKLRAFAFFGSNATFIVSLRAVNAP